MKKTRENPIRLSIFASADEANAAAADCLADWLADPGTRTFMAAAGNSPLEIYRRISERRILLGALSVFVLDGFARACARPRADLNRGEPRWTFPNDSLCLPLLSTAIAQVEEFTADTFDSLAQSTDFGTSA